jgi:hypothetical protein
MLGASLPSPLSSQLVPPVRSPRELLPPEKGLIPSIFLQFCSLFFLPFFFSSGRTLSQAEKAGQVLRIER